MVFTKTYHLVMSYLHLVYFGPQIDLHILYCGCGIEFIIIRNNFCQIVLCLHMCKINYSWSDSQNVNQHQLLCYIQLNCLLDSSGLFTLLAVKLAETLLSTSLIIWNSNLRDGKIVFPLNRSI